MRALKYKLLASLKRMAIVAPMVLALLGAGMVVAQPAYAVTSKCATASGACSCNSSSLTTENCGIVYYLWLVINFLSGLVALVVVISIIVAGIQWSTAGDNPQQIAAARNRILNSVIALAVFIFMYAFLQWVVPGGIF